MIQVRITAHTMIENTIMKLCGTRNFFFVAIVNIPPFYNVVSLYNIIPVEEKVCNFVFSNVSLKKSQCIFLRTVSSMISISARSLSLSV